MTTRVKLRRQTREHARLAEMILPPTPEGCPSYTRTYFESYRGRLFQACSNARHRHCPKTSDQGSEHLYCICPCHRVDLTKHQKRKLFLAMKKEYLKKKEKATRTPRAPGSRPTAPGLTRSHQKTFRYVKAPEKVPAGIMAVVHQSIATLKEGTVLTIADFAVTKGLKDFTSQDYVAQTSIMLHRLLKAGAVEVV